MMVLSNVSEQVIPVGGAITFNTIVVRSGNDCCHRSNTPSVRLSQNGNYAVSFNGNVSAAAATTMVNLAIKLGDSILPETTMTSTTVAASDFNIVSASTLVHICCDGYNSITIVNTGTVPVTIAANSSLCVYRL